MPITVSVRSLYQGNQNIFRSFFCASRRLFVTRSQPITGRLSRDSALHSSRPRQQIIRYIPRTMATKGPIDVSEAESSDKTPVLPLKSFRAKNNFDLGKGIGSAFKDWISQYMAISEDVTFLRRFYLTESGRKLYEGHLEASERCHPKVVEEVRGMAEGAGQTFEDMFLIQMLSDVLLGHSEMNPTDTWFDSKITPTDTPKGCTDVLLNTDKLRMIAHNEDWDDDVKSLVHVVDCTITGETEEEELERFVSFMFPGYLPGFTFAASRKLVITINSLRPVRALPGGVPIVVLLRACLKCETIEEVRETMLNSPIGCAFGINLNVAEIHSTRMCSLEVYPSKDGTVVDLKEVPFGVQGEDTWYHHQNHYKHVPGAEHRGWSESFIREHRVNEIGAPGSQDDIIAILGDQECQREPIFKDGDKEGRINLMITIATALINITERRIDVYRSNPKTTPKPCRIIPFP